jgi:hypothetical protein
MWAHYADKHQGVVIGLKPDIEKDSATVIKIVKESVKHFENALSIKDEETADYEIHNLIGLAYAFVFSKNHKYKISLDKTTLLYYQEQSLKYHHLSIEKYPKSVVDYEFLATRYSKYIDWTKEIKVLEMLNIAKRLNPPKADEYDRRIKAIEEEQKKEQTEERKWWQIF